MVCIWRDVDDDLEDLVCKAEQNVPGEACETLQKAVALIFNDCDAQLAQHRRNVS